MCVSRAICIISVLVSLAALPVSAGTTFDFHQESFISPDFGSDTNKSFIFAGLHLQSHPTPVGPWGFLKLPVQDLESTVFRMDVRAELSNTLEASYLNPRELNFQLGRVTLGRKRFNWSATDRQWGLGLIQPQFRWNPLAPQEQGLTGGFYEYQSSAWGFAAFASPLFVPDQGPGFLLKDGEFKRTNPWFQSQASTVVLTGSNKVRDLNYNVQTPSLDRIAINPSAGVSVNVGDEQAPAQLRVSSFYKPANQISLGINGTAEPSKTAHILVAPTFFYHMVSSADLVVRNRSWEWTVGALNEVSQEPRDMRAGFSYVAYSPMLLSSTSLAWQDMNNSVRLSGLYRDGGHGRTVGADTNDIAGLFSDRIPYKDAVALTLSTRQFWKATQGVSLSTTWLQGVTSGYAQWSFTGDFAIDRQWSVWGALMMVQADHQSPPLFRENEDNDSLRFGVSYVF